MNCEELMIGNQLIIGKGTDYQQYVVINEILNGSVILQGREFTTFIGSLDPIPISEELLLKNGFTKELLIEGNELYDDWVLYRKDCNGFFLEMHHCSNSIERDWSVQIDNDHHCSVGGMDVEYVHQLQNFCTLCGFEIEIVV